MRDNDLFQLALGITSPWFVASSVFDGGKKRLDIGVDFKAGSRFACPDCNADGCPVHDTTKKTWRHLDFFQHQAFLTARVPRITCTTCGVKQINVPWARKGSVGLPPQKWRAFSDKCLESEEPAWARQRATRAARSMMRSGGRPFGF
ncbi:MAG: transposase family protein [Hyphomicrobium aestuarii]|nr:transposase family protein [Hyphomicrobium aestuarii]